MSLVLKTAKPGGGFGWNRNNSALSNDNPA
jgi:hypothetical protein